MKIKTTHVGSLPRPKEMNTQLLRQKQIGDDDLRRYLAAVMEKQIRLGLSYINNGELPRSDYINATVGRIAGFFGTGSAPFPKDLEELPEYARRFSGRNGLITLNPKAPIQLPAASAELAFSGEASLRRELEMMIGVFDDLKQKYPAADAELFFTSPSPGTVALFLENAHYPNYETYLQKLGAVLQKEYEIINSYGVILQIDCPDLAMGRHTRYKDLVDDDFLTLIGANVAVLNRALAHIEPDKCRAHVCWGNYPGTHHCDIELSQIFNIVMGVKAKFISIESSNHRHAHEWEILKGFSVPQNKILMPGLIDTTSNTIEHPELVAQRLLNFANLLGPERIIGSTDCGFASTASAAGVAGDIAWLKLKSLVEGVNIAESKLA